jgi:hypothetical protein
MDRLVTGLDVLGSVCAEIVQVYAHLAVRHVTRTYTPSGEMTLPSGHEVQGELDGSARGSRACPKHGLADHLDAGRALCQGISGGPTPGPLVQTPFWWRLVSGRSEKPGPIPNMKNRVKSDMAIFRQLPA